MQPDTTNRPHFMDDLIDDTMEDLHDINLTGAETRAILNRHLTKAYFRGSQTDTPTIHWPSFILGIVVGATALGALIDIFAKEIRI